MTKLYIVGFTKINKTIIKNRSTAICDFCNDYNGKTFYIEKNDVDICKNCLEQLYEAKEILK